MAFPPISSLYGAFCQANTSPSRLTIFRGWTRWTADVHGEMHGQPLEGLYCGESQLMTHYATKVNGRAPVHRFGAQMAGNQWSEVAIVGKGGQAGDLPAGTLPRGSVELRTLRIVDSGCSQLLVIKNNGEPAQSVRMEIELVCPLGDSESDQEQKKERPEPSSGCEPDVSRSDDMIRLYFERSFGDRRNTPDEIYERAYGKHAFHSGTPVRRALEILVSIAPGGAPTHVRAFGGAVTRIVADVDLPGRGESRILFFFEPIIDGKRMPAPRDVRVEPVPRARTDIPEDSPRISTGNSTFNLILGQAQSDLSALRLPLFGFDASREHPEMVAITAGIPRYLGLFSRDNLIVAWQSAMLDQERLERILSRLGALQGIRYDPWREEEPGRLPHEQRMNPRSATGKMARELYFGDVTATPFWVIALATLYSWRGGRGVLEKHRATLEECCRWILMRLDRGHGYVFYAGGENRNQAWKDSGDGIVDENGRIVTPPLALVEIQGYCYQALREAARLMSALGEHQWSQKITAGADELKRRFNRDFWMEDDGFFAFALRGNMSQVKARASNIGHCLSTGIIDRDRIEPVIRLLMAPEFFSGWGVRTLSARNPGFDPFSYHRGSVWPVDNALIAEGMAVCGYREESSKVMEAQLELASLFPYMRLPEVVSGHSRSPDLPVPGTYPYANPLQAWSASAICQFVRMLGGIQPEAERHRVYVDPVLPDWMPWIEIRDLRIGSAGVSLRFWRDASGESHWQALESRGRIEILRGNPFEQGIRAKTA